MKIITRDKAVAMLNKFEDIANRKGRFVGRLMEVPQTMTLGGQEVIVPTLVRSCYGFRPVAKRVRQGDGRKVLSPKWKLPRVPRSRSNKRNQTFVVASEAQPLTK